MSKSKTSAVADLNKRRYGRLPKYLVHGAACFFCLVLGFTLFFGVFRRARFATADETPAPIEAPTSVPEEEPQFTLSQADELLTSDDPKNALDIYRHFDVAQPGGDAVRYRRALCQELLGDGDRAIQGYRAILDSSSHVGFVSAARFGLVRLHVDNGNWKAALYLLYSMVLTSGRRDQLAGTAAHRLAQVSTMQLAPEDRRPYQDEGILAPAWPEKIARLLALPLTLETSGPSSTDDSGIIILSTIQNDPALTQVAIRLQDASLPSLVDKLIHAAGLEPQWETAPTRKSSRRITVDVDDLDMATALDALLEPMGLAWTREDRTIRVVPVRTIPSSIRMKSRLARAERYCHNALALFPDQSRAVGTYFSLGNLAFLSGNFEQATNYYRQILQTSQRIEVLGDTWFNRAKASYRMNRMTDASNAFTSVVDHARGREIEAIAYLYLGTMSMREIDMNQSVRHLVRALSIAKDADLRRITAVTLASAYLLENNPMAANMTLMDQRDLLNSSPFYGNAWFLSSLARFRAARNPTERFHRGRTLTASLSEVTPDRFFSLGETLLLGQAYVEIGLPNEMQSIYAKLIRESEPSDARRGALLALADSYADVGEEERSIAIYQVMARDHKSHWSEQAQLRMAELDRLADRDDRCLERCLQLVGEPSSAETKSLALTLMGRVYESQADHYKAALCFAGMIPHVSTARAPSTGERHGTAHE